MQIEQIDRDAAAGFFDVAGWHGKGGSIRKGLRDDEPLVQAFAAHRLAARPDDSAVERVARALYEEDDPWCKAWPWPNLHSEQGDPDAYRRLARAAIRAMHHE